MNFAFSSLVDYLLSEDIMSTVGFGIGLRDLVLCQVSHKNYSQSMYYVRKKSNKLREHCN